MQKKVIITAALSGAVTVKSNNQAVPYRLEEFSEEDWPTSIELLYYAFHIMVGLGTIFILVMALSTLQLARRRLEQTRWLLWILTFAFPFTYTSLAPPENRRASNQ